MIRPLVRFALPFAAGVFLAQYVLTGLWRFAGALGVFAAGFLLAHLWDRHRAMLRLVSAALALGMTWLGVYDLIFLAPQEARVGEILTMTMELQDYPEVTDYGTKCVVRAESVSGKILLYGDETLARCRPGDYVTGEVKCYSAARMGGKPSAVYTSEGIFLRLYAQGRLTVTAGEDSVRFLPRHLKRAMWKTVNEVFQEDVRGLVLALLTGEKSELDAQAESDLREAGLMHLTAVSGLHCGFLISFLGLLMLRQRHLTVLVGYPVLILYAMMVGGTPSVVRSCIMVGFALSADLFMRENDPPTSLAAAAVVILLADPFAIGSVSFQLSFAAVTGLLAVSGRVQRLLIPLLRFKSRWTKGIWIFLTGNLSSSLGALVFTVPICASIFRTVSLVSPLANLMVLFIMPVVFAAALVVTVLCMCSPVFAVFAPVAALPAKYVLTAAGLAAKIPGHALSVTGWIPVMWLVLVYAMLALCAVSKDPPGKYILCAVLSVATLCAVRTVPMKLVENDRLTIVAVDVGQGAAALLHSGEQTVLVDCGSEYTPRGSGAAVADAMDTYGWKRLDYVALTHYHGDHSGGLDELLARVEVKMLLLPWVPEDPQRQEVLALAREYRVPIQYVLNKTDISLGNAVMTLYPPVAAGDANEEGLAILCAAGSFEALFTGDMGRKAEGRLAERYGLPDCEVLFVGHHGSKYSTSDSLLKAARPEVGVISVGENSYGHPNGDAMKRMAFRGMTLYRTDWQGNILIRVHQ